MSISAPVYEGLEFVKISVAAQVTIVIVVHVFSGKDENKPKITSNKKKQKRNVKKALPAK